MARKCCWCMLGLCWEFLVPGREYENEREREGMEGVGND